MSEWIDVSVPLRTGMVHWPGDPAVVIRQALDMTRGDSANLRTMSMSAHTGTHMDAPLHFVDGGIPIDRMPAEAGIGVARVIKIEDRESINRGEIEAHDPQPGERLLFKTPNSDRCWRRGRCFLKQYVSFTPDSASFLASCKVRTVGIDYLSVGSYGPEGAETHRILLGAGIWVIEGLDLSSVEAGPYEMVCLPLKIEGGDGAPARALLRRL